MAEEVSVECLELPCPVPGMDGLCQPTGLGIILGCPQELGMGSRDGVSAQSCSPFSTGVRGSSEPALPCL